MSASQLTADQGARHEPALGTLAWRNYRGELWNLLLIPAAIVLLVPIFWMFDSSFKSVQQNFAYPPVLIPDPLFLENYTAGVAALPFVRYTVNTLFLTITATFGLVASSSLVGFGFARLRFPGKGPLFTLCLSTLMLPSAVLLIPSFIIFKTLGWVGTFLPLIVPNYFGGAFSIFLFRQFLMGIPMELDEAARVDGAGTFRIWARIIMPNAMPAIAAVSIFSLVDNWNAFLGPLIYLNAETQGTIALALNLFAGRFGALYTGQLMALSTLSLVPVLILFFVAQRYFMEGITISGFGGR